MTDLFWIYAGLGFTYFALVGVFIVGYCVGRYTSFDLKKAFRDE